MTDLKISRQQGATGGAGESADQTTTFLRKDGTYQVPGTAEGVFALPAGSDTSAVAAGYSVPVPVSGTATQLSTASDVMFYVNVKTAATLALSMGPDSTATEVPLFASATDVANTLIGGVRVPKGWYVKLTYTSADCVLNAVPC